MLSSRLLRFCIPFLSYGVSGCSLLFVSGPPQDASKRCAGSYDCVTNEDPYANVERWAGDVEPDPSRAFDSASAVATRAPRPDPIECTSSRAWPIVDTVSASISTVVAMGAAVLLGAGEHPKEGSEFVALVPLGSAALWGGSAIYGFSKTSECRAAKRAAAEREQVRRRRQAVAPRGPEEEQRADAEQEKQKQLQQQQPELQQRQLMLQRQQQQQQQQTHPPAEGSQPAPAVPSATPPSSPLAP